jgi:hypothetical protein
MEWFEYAEAEQQLEVLESHLRMAQTDLITYEEDLSPISIRAIKNEIVRLDMYKSDLEELLEVNDGE